MKNKFRFALKYLNVKHCEMNKLSYYYHLIKTNQLNGDYEFDEPIFYKIILSTVN